VPRAAPRCRPHGPSPACRSPRPPAGCAATPRGTARDRNRPVHPRPADVFQLADRLSGAAVVAGHAEAGDVQHGEDARGGDVDDVPPEGGEGGGAGRPGIDGGGDPTRQALGAGSTPSGGTPQKTWVCKSTRPGVTSKPAASTTPFKGRFFMWPLCGTRRRPPPGRGGRLRFEEEVSPRQHDVRFAADHRRAAPAFGQVLAHARPERAVRGVVSQHCIVGHRHARHLDQP
jgi:hypothetical protein